MPRGEKWIFFGFQILKISKNLKESQKSKKILGNLSKSREVPKIQRNIKEDPEKSRNFLEIEKRLKHFVIQLKHQRYGLTFISIGIEEVNIFLGLMVTNRSKLDREGDTAARYFSTL